jgi:hypothetical protein
MKLSKTSRKWLGTYLSCRLNITGEETKAQLLHTCKILGLPGEVSDATFERVERKMKNEAN